MNVIMLGPPGAGKGTQAKIILEHTGLTHLSTGDLFRAALREGTELGMLAKSYMDRGALVPDRVVIDMVMERTKEPDCVNGVIFDGFPRTIDQAKALQEEMTKYNKTIDAVLYLDVPQEVLLRRIAGRQTCSVCGAIFNIYYYPSYKFGTCDVCGGKLYQRSDDTMETAQRRLDVYFEQTMPLIDYYRNQGNLHKLNGQREVAQVTEEMMVALGVNA